ncbi:hypothetical protein CLAIMM_14321 [Cladophialophora immunda]|nr:hypothetical protein CLAIMM_14321 [Cladophialophora immunda]
MVLLPRPRQRGRTAHIGNEGLATSFDNEGDEALGPFLTKILLKTNQDLPDFLTGFKPEGDLSFDEEEEEPDSENNDGATSGDAGGDVWATAGDAATAGGDAWDADRANAASDAWGTAAGTDTTTIGNWTASALPAQPGLPWSALVDVCDVVGVGRIDVVLPRGVEESLPATSQP